MIHHRWLATTFVFLAAFLVATPLSAEVIAEFVGGGSNTDYPNNLVTDVVDAYSGMAGGGWSIGWGERTTGTHTVATDNTDPLHTGPGGDLNYLECTVTSASTARKYGSVARDYDAGIDVTKSHSIDFLCRIDEGEDGHALTESAAFEDFNDRYQMWDEDYDLAGSIGDTVGLNCSWAISVYGGIHDELPIEKVGHWIVFDGAGAVGDTGFLNARNVDTGITVKSGVIYAFHLDIDMDTDDGDAAKTWDVTITGSDGSSFDSKTQGENPDHPGTPGFEEGLGWRADVATVGATVHLNGCTDYDGSNVDLREYSFDAVRVVPEPSTLALGLTLIVAGFWSFRRSRR